MTRRLQTATMLARRSVMSTSCCAAAARPVIAAGRSFQSVHQPASFTMHNMFMPKTRMQMFGSLVQVALPDLGEGTKEATVKEWYVKPGERVSEVSTRHNFIPSSNCVFYSSTTSLRCSRTSWSPRSRPPATASSKRSRTRLMMCASSATPCSRSKSRATHQLRLMKQLHRQAAVVVARAIARLPEPLPHLAQLNPDQVSVFFRDDRLF